MDDEGIDLANLARFAGGESVGASTGALARRGWIFSLFGRPGRGSLTRSGVNALRRVARSKGADDRHDPACGCPDCIGTVEPDSKGAKR